MKKSNAVPKKPSRKRKSYLGLLTALGILGLLAMWGLSLDYSRPHVSGDNLRLSEFYDKVDKGKIRSAVLLDSDHYITGQYLRDDGVAADYNTPYLQTGLETTVILLRNSRIDTTIDQQTDKKTVSLLNVGAPVMVIAVAFSYLVMSWRKGTGLFNTRSGARKIQPGKDRVTFADVAGQEAAKTELREINEFLANSGRFAALGATMPKGILLFGPPGCGKTLLARAVAGEAGAAFFSISGSDFVELYAGVGAAKVRELFKEARENVPAIVFIDELDSVGKRRGSRVATSDSSQGEQEQALNQILAEMDGVSPMQGIIVMGATNRPDVLDPALLRPGRFDRTIGLERPDEAGRIAVLTIHAANKPLHRDVDLKALASRGIGLSGADMASVMNEGAILSARAGKTLITQAELELALTRILEAPERQRRLSMRDRTFGRSIAPEKRVTFADVAGLEEAVEELREVKDYLAGPERFLKLGATPPRGFLLVGPPGCGKTLIAKAVAVEANAAFFSVSATEFVEIFVGEGAGRVRDLFAEARAAAPAIVFIDEIDAIGARRQSGSSSGQRESDQTLNQILIELDGFEARSGVMIMAASNRPEILDEALVRPGRFDRTIRVGLPVLSSRRAILALHAKDKVLAPDVDLERVAAMTQGFSGADLANVMNEAALLAGRHHMFEVPMALVEEAIERVGVGVASSDALQGEDRIMVAYHETGHALVGRALQGVGSLHKISLIQRGGALGASWHSEGDRVVHTKSALIDRLAQLLGGRAAEELVFGEPGSGSADDLLKAAELARAMVCEWGMSSEVGLAGVQETSGNGAQRQRSEDMAAKVETEIRRFLDEAYDIAAHVLRVSRAELNRVAEALLAVEVLTGAQIDELAGPPPVIRPATALPATPAPPVPAA